MNANGKGKSRAEPENSMEGFGGIVGIGQQKKNGSMSVQNPMKKSDDPKGGNGLGLGIGIGGGVQGLSGKDKRQSASGNTP